MLLVTESDHKRRRKITNLIFFKFILSICETILDLETLNPLESFAPLLKIYGTILRENHLHIQYFKIGTEHTKKLLECRIITDTFYTFVLFLGFTPYKKKC